VLVVYNTGCGRVGDLKGVVEFAVDEEPGVTGNVGLVEFEEEVGGARFGRYPSENPCMTAGIER
jgi:hypothetical protein